MELNDGPSVVVGGERCFGLIALLLWVLEW